MSTNNNGITLKRLSLMVGIYTALLGGFIYFNQPKNDIIEIKKDIKEIKENHLKHLKEDIVKNETDIDDVSDDINQIKLDINTIKTYLEIEK